MNERLRPWRDAAIFRAYETRALKARRDRFARRYAADVIARAPAPTPTRSGITHEYEAWLGFSSKILVSAPEAARNDEIAGWIAVWCARERIARSDILPWTHEHIPTHASIYGPYIRRTRRRSFEANAFLCRDLAARAKHPALACQPTRSPPLLGSNSRLPTLLLDTAPNVPRETFLY